MSSNNTIAINRTLFYSVFVVALSAPFGLGPRAGRGRAVADVARDARDGGPHHRLERPEHRLA